MVVNPSSVEMRVEKYQICHLVLVGLHLFRCMRGVSYELSARASSPPQAFLEILGNQPGSQICLIYNVQPILLVTPIEETSDGYRLVIELSRHMGVQSCTV